MQNENRPSIDQLGKPIAPPTNQPTPLGGSSGYAERQRAAASGGADDDISVWGIIKLFLYIGLFILWLVRMFS